MSTYKENLAALKSEYELKMAELEAENARLRGEKKSEEEKRIVAAAQYEKYLEEYVSVKLFRIKEELKKYLAQKGFSV